MTVPNDLVMVDIDTAIVLYSKGYRHIPILKRDGFSQDWSSMQPLYLDDLLDGVIAFASDSKREELLNPPVTDIGRMKEEIYLEAAKPAPVPTESLDEDVDDDPDWVETETVEVECIPDEDASVPTVSKVTEETDKPKKWDIKEVIRLREKDGMSTIALGKMYGVSPQTVLNRINHYKAKS